MVLRGSSTRTLWYSSGSPSVERGTRHEYALFWVPGPQEGASTSERVGRVPRRPTGETRHIEVEWAGYAFAIAYSTVGDDGIEETWVQRICP